MPSTFSKLFKSRRDRDTPSPSLEVSPASQLQVSPDTSNRGNDGDYPQLEHSRVEDAYGTTVLADSGASSRVDVVFVHGLTGKSVKTWRNTTNNFLWPAELSEDIGPARVVAFGYDADVASFFGQVSQNRLGEHAQALLGDLTRLRNSSNTEARPIVFVAHSLGGLVVEKALCLSRARAAQHLRSIEKHTFAIAFLGTPHAGSDLAAWAVIGGKLIATLKHVNKNILRTLERESEVLRDTQDGFGQLLESRKDEQSRIQITCFYEELGVPGVGQVVPASSAILFGCDWYGIHANHMDMTKFASHADKNYERILGELQRWMKDAKLGNAQAAPGVSLETKDCIKSLYYPEITQGMSSIYPAHPHPFDWIWKRDYLAFETWLKQPHGLYWIQGNPGSGKSTLMKALARSSEVTKKLQSAQGMSTAGGTNVAVASFSFRFKSGEVAGSITGMLRSLLWQLMQTMPWAGSALLEQFKTIKATQPEVHWLQEDLELALLALFKESGTVAVCILIDGLDEHHGKDEDIARLFDMFTQSIPPNVRLCVASRPYPDFAFQFKNAMGFTLHEQTGDDISIYVRDRLQDIALHNNDSYHTFAQSVIQRARGSFIWVKLACDELQRTWRRCRSFSELQSCINGMPHELNQFYYRIFEQLNVDDSTELAWMLTVVLSAARPLSVVEFCHALDLGSSCPGDEAFPYSMRPKYISQAHHAVLFGSQVGREAPRESLEEWDKRITHRIGMAGRGLIQVRKSAVTFSHETVADFWIRNASSLWSYGPAIGQHFMLNACIAYMKAIAKSRKFERSTVSYQAGIEQHDEALDCPFIAYSVRMFTHHCQQAEWQSGESQRGALRNLTEKVLDFWLGQYRMWTPIVYRWKQHANSSTIFLELAVATRIERTALDIMSSLADNELTMLGNDILYHAADLNNPDILSELLRCGVRLRDRSRTADTAPHRALVRGRLRFLEAYLKSYQIELASHRPVNQHCLQSDPGLFASDSDRRNPAGLYHSKLTSSLLGTAIFVESEAALTLLLGFPFLTPAVTGELGQALLTAAYHGRTWAVKALLKQGVDPNITAESCQAQLGVPHSCCPLNAAISRGDVEICSVLLNHGANPMFRMSHETCSILSEGLAVKCGLKTPFLVAMLEFIQLSLPQIFDIMKLLYSHGAVLEEYSRLMVFMSESQRTWLLEASEKHHNSPGFVLEVSGPDQYNSETPSQEWMETHLREMQAVPHERLHVILASGIPRLGSPVPLGLPSTY